MASDRSTKIDAVLQIVGVLAIICGVLFVGLAWPDSSVKNDFARSLGVSTALNIGGSTIVSGIILIGFGTVIRIIDEIRGEVLIIARRDTRLPIRDAAAYEISRSGDEHPLSKIDKGGEPGQIIESPDGSFVVEGRKFKDKKNAEAYLDLADMVRRQ